MEANNNNEVSDQKSFLIEGPVGVSDEYQNKDRSMINFAEGEKPDMTIEGEDNQKNRPKRTYKPKKEKEAKPSVKRTIVNSDYVYGQPDGSEQLVLESFSSFLFKQYNSYKTNHPDTTPEEFFATFINPS